MNILYLSWTGLSEPLGKSQVLSYLKHLSRDHRITVVSMEKPEDAADPLLMADVRATCDAHQIEWIARRYHRRPRLLARPLDMLQFWWIARQVAPQRDAKVVHARSYIASFVASLLGRPFIFDMRSLWPEELIVAGRLRRGSLLHGLIRRVERRLLSRAAAVVSLTQAAVDHLKAERPELASKPVAVIPTCADLDRFRPLAGARAGERGRIGTAGTLASGWFWQDWLMTFFRTYSSAHPEAEFHIISRDPPGPLRAEAAAAGVPLERLHLYGLKPEEVATALQQLDALVMFFQTGISKLGSCPTRMAEALGCGMPVVTNDGVGDVAAIVREHRVGVIVDANDPAAMAEAAAELDALLQDPDITDRCRRTAESLFSVERGAKIYAGLYELAAAGSGTAES